MSKNEFDELLLKKLQEEELDYDPKHWEHLSQLLPPSLSPAANRGRKWLVATGIAAAAAFVLAAVFYMKLVDKDNEPAPALAQQPAVPAKPEAATPSETAQQPEANAQTGQQSIAPVLTGNSSQRPGNSRPQQALPATHQPAAPAQVVPQQAPEPAPVPEGIAHKAPETQPVLPQSPAQQAAESAVVTKRENRPQASFPIYDNYGSQKHNYNSGAKANRTSVSLGGGVNYGNLNTGYTVGVSARTKIAGNFFVDGAVAMMYNNNTNNVVNYNGASSLAKGGLAARPSSAQLPASPAVEPTQNLYYVQVNPSIGYQIDKNVALSVGSDFQQMLSRTDGAEKVQLAADNAKIFPAFDVGLTTKSEFNITPRIQAGLLYREGLSNLLKNDGNKYVNRRYFQVQFKYNIPVN